MAAVGWRMWGGGGGGEKATGCWPGHLSGLMHREMKATMSTWLIWEEGGERVTLGGGGGGGRNKEGCGCEGEGRMVTKTLGVSTLTRGVTPGKSKVPRGKGEGRGGTLEVACRCLTNLLTKEMKPVKMCGATKSTWICCCLGVGGM